MKSRNKLNISIAAYTSEADNHPVDSLISSIHGWHSEKYCPYPQELIFRFEGRVKLNQLKVLSHEYKIAQRIEVFYGELKKQDLKKIRSNRAASYRHVTFQKLGYISLTDNHSSGFKEREMRIVNLGVTCTHIKLRINSIYPNDLNIYDQCAIVGIRCLGDMITRFAPSVGNPIPDIGYQYDPEIAKEVKQKRNPTESNDDFSDTESDISYAPDKKMKAEFVSEQSLDKETRNTIKQLERQKRMAVESEQYDKAAELKEEINMLKKQSSQLIELERKKKHAVENEQYREANILKRKIEALKNKNSMESASSSIVDSPTNFGTPMRRRSSTYEEYDERPIGTPGKRPPPSAQSSRMSSPPRDRMRRSSLAPIEDDIDSPNSPSHLNYEPKSSIQDQQEDVDYDDRPIVGMPQQVALANYNQQIQKPPQVDDEEYPEMNMVSSSPNIRNSYDQQQVQDLDDEGPSTDEIVKDLEDWEKEMVMAIRDENETFPDQLPSNTDTSGLVKVFGEYVTQCLYSGHQRRVLREIAVRVIIQHIKKLPADKTILFTSCMSYILDGLMDQIPQVYFACIRLLRAVLAHTHSELKRSTLHHSLHPLIKPLVDKLADTNTRQRDAAQNIIFEIVDIPSVTLGILATAVLKISKHNISAKHWRPIQSRLLLLSECIAKYNIDDSGHIAGAKEFSEDAVMRFVQFGLTHSRREVRDAAVNVVLEVWESWKDRGQSATDFEKKYLNHNKIRDALRREILSKMGQAVSSTNVRTSLESVRRATGTKSSSKKKEDAMLDEMMKDMTSLGKSTDSGKKASSTATKKKKPKVTSSSKPVTPPPEEEEEDHVDDDIQAELDAILNDDDVDKLVDNLVGDGDEEDGEDYLMLSVEMTNEDMVVCHYCDETIEVTDSKAPLDDHLLNDCPMVAPCPLCYNVDEISTLNDHLINSCSGKDSLKECQRCKMAIRLDQYEAHIKAKQCEPASSSDRRCPLCTEAIPDDNDAGRSGWKIHLIDQGCPANVRTANIFHDDEDDDGDAIGTRTRRMLNLSQDKKS